MATPDVLQALALLGSAVVVPGASNLVGDVRPRRLDALGAPAELKGKLGIANAKLAYARYRELFSPASELWADLLAAGAQPQRCLWASTSTKNPAYRDVLYVEELIGADTVNTMPEETIEAFQDHGEVALTLEQGVDEAERLLEEIAAAGGGIRSSLAEVRAASEATLASLWLSCSTKIASSGEIGECKRRSNNPSLKRLDIPVAGVKLHKCVRLLRRWAEGGGMKGVELYGQVRRGGYGEGLSRREAGRGVGVCPRNGGKKCGVAGLPRYPGGPSHPRARSPRRPGGRLALPALPARGRGGAAAGPPRRSAGRPAQPLWPSRWRCSRRTRGTFPCQVRAPRCR